MLKPKVSEAIVTQLPAFFAEDFPSFEKFMQAYYEFLELENNASNVVRSMLENRDIDSAAGVYLQLLKKTVLPILPTNTTSNALLIKNLREILIAKGTEKSFALIMQAVFGIEATVENQYDKVLRLSSNIIEKMRIVILKNPVGLSHIGDLLGGWINQALPKTHIFIEGVQAITWGSSTYYICEIDLEKSFGDLTADNVVEIELRTGSTITATVGHIIGKVTIESSGFLNPLNSKVKLISGSGGYAEAYIDDVSSGGLTQYTIINGGSGYVVGDTINIVSRDGYGAGATAKVATIDGTGAILSVVMSVDTATVTSTTPGYLGQQFLLNETENDGTILTVSSVSGGNITGLTVTNGGEFVVSPLKIWDVKTKLIDVVGSTSTLTLNLTYKVKRIIVSNPGHGYSAAAVNISGGKGTDGNFLPHIVDGAIKQVTVSSGGNYYATAQAAVLGHGTGAILTPVISGGVITGVTVVDCGQDYQATDTIVVTGTATSGHTITPAVLTLTGNIVNGAIRNIHILNGGTGYPTAATFSVTGNGSSATVTPVISKGVIQKFTVGNVGSGYTTAAIVENAVGTTASLGSPVVAVNGEVKTYNITKPGAGYWAVDETTPISLIISDPTAPGLALGGTGYTSSSVGVTGDGGGFSATTIMSGGKIVGVNISSGGSGYTYANVTFTGNGTGAFGTAIIKNGKVASIVMTTGRKAVIRPVMSNGRFINVQVVDGGYGYVTPPTITLTGGAPVADSTGYIPPVNLFGDAISSASFTAVVDTNLKAVSSVTIDASGANYIQGTSISSFGDGTGFSATPIINSKVDQITINSGGVALTTPRIMVYEKQNAAFASTINYWTGIYDLTGWSYSGTGTNTTTSVTVPNGTTATVRKLQATAANYYAYLSLSSYLAQNATWTFSTYVQPIGSVTQTKIVLPGTLFADSSGSARTATFTMTGSGSYSYTSVSSNDQAVVGIQKVSNNWYRIWFTAKITAAAPTGNIQMLSSLASAGADGILTYGMQAEKSAFPTTLMNGTRAPTILKANVELKVANGKIVASNIISSDDHFVTPQFALYHDNGNTSLTAAVNQTTNTVTSITVDCQGTYTSPPSIVIIGDGSSATGTPVTSYNAGTGLYTLTGVNTTGGSGYTWALAYATDNIGTLPSVSDISVKATRGLSGITIVSGGTDYNTILLNVVGDGKDAKLTAQSEGNGGVKSVSVVSGGTSYTNIPNVWITETGGNGSITGVTITDIGKGYISVPYVSGSSSVLGKNAKIAFYGPNVGAAKSVAFTNFGAGYDNPPVPQFPLTAIVTDSFGPFKNNELVYVQDYTYPKNLDGTYDYTQGPHGTVYRSDTNVNSLTLIDASEIFVLTTEEGYVIQTEDNLDLITEDSYDIGPGNVIVGTESNIEAKIIITDRAAGYVEHVSVGKYPTTLTSNSGFLSDTGIMVADSNRIQDFSYSVKTGLQLSDYAQVLKQMIHPAGYKMFGEVQIDDYFKAKVNFPMNVNLAGQAAYEILVLYISLFADTFKAYQDSIALDKLRYLNQLTMTELGTGNTIDQLTTFDLTPYRSRMVNVTPEAEIAYSLSLAAPTAGTYTVGQTLTWTLTVPTTFALNTNVVPVGNPTLKVVLGTNTTPLVIPYDVATSTATSWKFKYTVPSGSVVVDYTSTATGNRTKLAKDIFFNNSTVHFGSNIYNLITDEKVFIQSDTIPLTFLQ